MIVAIGRYAAGLVAIRLMKMGQSGKALI